MYYRMYNIILHYERRNMVSIFWLNRFLKISLYVSVISLVILFNLKYEIKDQQLRIFKAQASDIYVDYDTGTLYIHGRIAPHIFDEILKIDFDKIHTVDLHSVGGDYVTSMLLSEWIHDYKWNTYVDTGNFCFSGCTVMFQAGANRTAHYTSRFMYHYPTSAEFVSVKDFRKDKLTNYILGQRMFDLMETYGLSIEFRDQVDRWKNLDITPKDSMKYNIVQNLEIESWSFEWLEYQISQIY